MVSVVTPASTRMSVPPQTVRSAPDSRCSIAAVKKWSVGKAILFSLFHGFIDQARETAQFLWSEFGGLAGVAEMSGNGALERPAEKHIEHARQSRPSRLTAR